ncbi:MAG: AbiV family abortive infection protein [Patescibacteria group bacterium]|nr:AbiV family abortive infection protein [Patescibacteria group bacterium]
MNKKNIKKTIDGMFLVYKNAVNLYEEAKILFNNKRYSRAYVLGVISFEELGKLIMVGSEIINIINERPNSQKIFIKKYKSHINKISRSILANSKKKVTINYITRTFLSRKQKAIIMDVNKQEAFYVNYNKNKFVAPNDKRFKKKAKNILNECKNRIEKDKFIIEKSKEEWLKIFLKNAKEINNIQKKY